SNPILLNQLSSLVACRFSACAPLALASSSHRRALETLHVRGLESAVLAALFLLQPTPRKARALPSSQSARRARKRTAPRPYPRSELRWFELRHSRLP